MVFLEFLKDSFHIFMMLFCMLVMCYDYGLMLCLLTHLPHWRRPRSVWDLPIFNFYALGTCTVQGTLSSDGRRSSQSRTSLSRLSFVSLLIIRFLLALSRSVSVLGPCTVHKRCNMYGT
jgi:hypothetical protein